MGFGAGALISSIAYESVPESLVSGNGLLALAFALGALGFLVVTGGLTGGVVRIAKTSKEPRAVRAQPLFSAHSSMVCRNH